MPGVLHIGNGALPAFTMGGLILSLVNRKYLRHTGRKKFLYILLAVVLFSVAAFISRKFWVLSKIAATPPWVFYVTAIAIGMYALLTLLANAGKAGWLNIIKPAGTATLTCYVVPYVSYGLADLTGIVLPDWFTHGFMGVVNCFTFALVIIGVVWLMGKVRIKLKI